MKLEDSYTDIVLKAMNGHGLGRRSLSKAIFVDTQKLSAFLKGYWEENLARKICHKLAINYHALYLIATEQYAWNSVLVTPEVHSIKTTFEMPNWGEATVNNYFVEIEPKRHLLFDTGTQPSKLMEFLEKHSTKVEAIFITHNHKDHTFGLEEMAKLVSPDNIYPYGNCLLKTAKKVEKLQSLNFGSLQVKSYKTPGHTLDGTSFLISGLSKPIVVTGDALFAGSIGGVGRDLYTDALQNVREKILSLPDETIILPGHGPITTVEIEKKRNPFFADSN